MRPATDAFQDKCSQCVIAKYPRHGISYDRGCQCKTLFGLGQSAPKMDASSTDVLNVTLFFVKAQCPPKMDAFYDRDSQCETWIGGRKCLQIS